MSISNYVTSYMIDLKRKNHCKVKTNGTYFIYIYTSKYLNVRQNYNIIWKTDKVHIIILNYTMINGH